MSKRVRLFVLNEPYALRLSGALACEIGFKESIVLLQIEFLIGISNTQEQDGEMWTYQSLEDLRVFFPWWSTTTIYRILKSLEEKKLIKIGNFNKLKFDRTQWFALDREGVSKLESIRLLDDERSSIFQNEKSILSKWKIEYAKMKNPSCQNETTLPENTTEIP